MAIASSEPETASPPAPAEPLRKTAPGALWPWVKRASWVELAIFAGLCFFWLAPGFDHESMIFGWAHGLGFIALCVLIWIAILRREAPYTLLAATLTPVGPLGSVIGIGVIERRRDREDSSERWRRQGGPDAMSPAPPSRS